MKKITALLIAFIIILSFSACGQKDEIPDGMVLASLADEPFKLFVPEKMTLNTSSGISSAFSYSPEKTIVCARYYTPDVQGMTLNDYVSYCVDSYALSIEAFTFVSLSPTVLSGKDALKLVYTAKIDGNDYTCTQFTATHNGDMISLFCYVPTSVSANFEENLLKIAKEFIICDKPEPINDEYVDKKTPEGMKIASNDKLEYRLYVPKSWICDSQSERSEAYYPESGKTNVTVTSFSPETQITLAEYILSCEDLYAKSLSGYELIDKTETTVDAKEAFAVNFKTAYDGYAIKTRQYFVTYSGLFYTITYTATEENFELHLADLEKIVTEFDFR